MEALRFASRKLTAHGETGMTTVRELLTRRRLIRNGALVVSGSLCTHSVPGFPHIEGGASSAGDNTAKSWTIGNELVKRVLTFVSDGGLFTEQFSDLSTRTDLIRSGKTRDHMGQEFSFVCNGQECANTAFDLAGAAESAFPKGKSLALRLRHKELPLEVTLIYSVYDGHAAVRKHLVLRNTGTTSLRLSHMKIEALGIALGLADEITLLTQYGAVPREIFYTGRSEDACLLVANGKTGGGIAVMNEVPGYMKRTEIAGWDDTERTRIGVMYDTDLMPFERTLAPGQEYATASASLVPFRNGDGFNDPHWRLPSYSAQVLERRVDAAGPPWIYNTWEPFERGINRDITMELIDAASAMGMDIFTIDDGWQSEYGENAVNLPAFPGGLEPVLETLRKRGMRLGLWIPMAAIGTSTAVYREHPEWAALDQEGKPKITGTAAGPKAVMCMASAFRETVAARVLDAIERFHLAYVKLDLTTIFNAYGEAPGCWAKGHDHGSWAESLDRIYEGISYVTGRIYEKHPDVLLDLTFELWGQKHIIDAGLLAAGDLDWMSNVDDTRVGAAGPIQARQLLYQRAVSMPVESMLIGNLHADVQPIEERFATAIGSAPLLLGDLRKLSAADRTWFHEKITWFKKLRAATRISESFFPLGSWQQTTPAAWDGFARLARNGTGVISLFRNKSNVAEALVQLPLIPVGRYKVRSEMTGRELGTFADPDWKRGVHVAFPDGHSVEVLEVTAANG
jgi:alpha-galactosidase